MWHIPTITSVCTIASAFCQNSHLFPMEESTLLHIFTARNTWPNETKSKLFSDASEMNRFISNLVLVEGIYRPNECHQYNSSMWSMVGRPTMSPVAYTSSPWSIDRPTIISSLHQLTLRGILALLLILQSQCMITFPKFLNFASFLGLFVWPTEEALLTRAPGLFHCSHYRNLSHALRTWSLQLPLF